MRVIRRRRTTERFSTELKGTSPQVCRHPADLEPSLQSNLEVYMKMIKSLVLGSAAGLLAMSGAQAADLPVKAKAVEYVRICSLYGAGFFYIPGTDTCIKFGGYLRVDTTFNAAGVQDQPSWNGDSWSDESLPGLFLHPVSFGADRRYPGSISTRSSREHPYWVRLVRSRRPS